MIASAQTPGILSREPIGAFLDGVLPPVPPAPATSWSAEVAFPSLVFTNAVGLAPVPGTNLLCVWEREGRIWVFENDSAAATKTLLIDLSAQCQGWDDSGLLGVAFHPDFAVNRQVFVWYNWVTPGTVIGDPLTRPPTFTPNRNRLARYTVDDNMVAELTSEVILIDQNRNSVWHSGGGMFFHPIDGFLYLTNGDDANAGGNSQRIDGDLFSGVLRIDVDERGDPISHPIPRQPLNGTTAHYFIPNDNPFVGQPGVLEEFFAIGLRSPHRMTHDPGSGRIFIGDVGEGSREEISIIEPNDPFGLNFQWSQIEGLGGDLIPPYIGINRRPTIDYPHGDDGAAIIGGYVYRGTFFAADLGGKYIFGDNISNRIWWMDESTEPATKHLLCILPKGSGPNSGNDYVGLSSFGLDHAGELLLCQMSSTGGQIYRLRREGPPAGKPFPNRLSEIGAFTDLTTLEASPELIPFTVNSPLWSDGAAKSRWMAVPNDGAPYAADERVSYAPKGEWRFPAGTVFVKHFELPIDDTDSSKRRRLETRFLVRDTNGTAYGVTYRWRLDQSDADLLPDGLDEAIPIATASGVRTQMWHYPSRQECLSCHTPAANFVLGVKTRQLNGDYGYPSGVTDNQLHTWNHLDLFDPPINDADISSLDRLVTVTDSSATLEHRVRSYFDANCSNCHRPGGAQAVWDARYDTLLANANIIDGNVLNSLGIDDARAIAPKDIWRSIIHVRMSSTRPDRRMPPLARNLVDDSAVATLTEWINGLTGTPALAPPTANPPGGPVDAPVAVTLNHPDPLAEIRYSIDDSDVTSGSTLYTGAVAINNTATLKARAFRSGFTPSVQTSARFAFQAAGGLLADYFNDRDLGEKVLTRLDPVVDFDWGGGSPDPFIQPDTFSARWTGLVKPKYDEPYNFYVTVDDGVRLWVAGQLVVDAWIDQSPTQWTGAIALTAGQLADIQLEYYENGGGALMRLEWESFSQPREVVPADRLYPPADANQQPAVALTKPSAGEVFNDPTEILLEAEASDDDGTVVRVDFFANGTKVGEADAEPFEFHWAGMDPSTYILHARAVDEDGGVSLSAPVPITVTTSLPIGLEAEYFNNMTLTPPAVLQRRDFRVNFDWGGGSPDPLVFPDNFSARWSGWIVPRFSEPYTFAVVVDDGARLWVNGNLLIDTWIDQGPTRHEGYITLEAGQAYDIELEYYENGGGAVVSLYWSSPSQSEEIVPPSQLQPPGPGNRRPRPPQITEPFVDGQLVNFADVHMETGPFSDPNPDDTHLCSDFEIWTAGLSERVWATECVSGIEKIHTHLGDGVFEGSHAGRTELFPETDYVLRIRHKDNSGDPATEWSAWATRFFRTTTELDPIPGQPGWITYNPGYKVELVASGFQLPVGIAFLTDPGSDPGDPYFYVAELYGAIKVVSRNGSVSDYVTGLLNFDPTGAFPGSGEQGVGGFAVDPVSGDIFVSLLYSSNPGDDTAPHYPKVIRLHSEDGGRTAAVQTTVLDMPGETQGQSHQVSHVSIGPDGLLYVHMGDGLEAFAAQDLTSFRGKILRLNLDGTPSSDNPFYNVAGGIGPADYVYAFGFRNPFGGTWREADGKHYSVENGPSVDRFAQIVPGRNYLWDGSDESMFNYAIYNWIPSAAPVNVAFVEESRFGGSGFPRNAQGHAFVSESGPTWGTGPQFFGKRISEFTLDADGNLIAGPSPLVEYNGTGKASVVALAAGPDGLYFSDFYKDRGYVSPIDRGANVLRVRWLGLNQPPITGLDSAEVRAGETLKLPVVKLIANDIDPDDDPVEFAGVNPVSFAGGTVAVENGIVVYTAPAEWLGFDFFFYSVSDGRGGSGDGFVIVTSDITQELPGLNLISMTFLPEGGLQLNFLAIPNRRYVVEYTENLTPPIAWTSLGTTTANRSGVVTVLDSAVAPDGGRFYRIRSALDR